MRYLSIEEAARVLGLSRSTLYKKTSAKSICRRPPSGPLRSLPVVVRLPAVIS